MGGVTVRSFVLRRSVRLINLTIVHAEFNPIKRHRGPVLTGAAAIARKLLKYLVGATGLEPVTPSFEG